MFERYNINDLFIASVSVSYPENKLGVDKIGGILEIATAGYGYVTILRKDKDKYIDLQDGSTLSLGFLRKSFLKTPPLYINL